MPNKRFYRKDGTERKREFRQRTTTIEQHSKLTELQASSHLSNIVVEESDEISMTVEDIRTNAEDNALPDINEEQLNTFNVEINNSYSSEDEDEDTDDEDDNILEFINFFDDNHQRKLYPSSTLSIYEACMVIIKLARDLNLNKLQIQRLLNKFRLLLPLENNLPRTVAGLLKTVDIDCSKKVSYYCRECFHPLLSIQQTECTHGCSMNNQRRPFKNVSELVICDVKKEILTTTKRYLKIIQEYQNGPGTNLPGDILNGKIYKKLPSNGSSNLTLILHTDGAPVTKVGGKSLWPVQCTLAEIPPPLRDYVDATMILGVWLGGTHPNRNLLWSKIVEQIRDLFKNGITVTSDTGEKIKFTVRAQLVTFDLPALAQNCNIIQFNGYDACPDCDVHGVAIERQVYYPFYQTTTATPKTDHDYTTLSLQKFAATISKGIKGPTPLTQILVFPDQIAKDYMHLVCSGHFKTLVTYWEGILLPGVFEQGSNYLMSIILPHSFKYQFSPLIQYPQWKTKMFRDFLLFISPVFAALFLPDALALHFLHYYIYIRALYYYEDISELDDIESLFKYYYEHITNYYGDKSSLCTLHLHMHLKDQVMKHGALVFTSCFARESYIGYALKWVK